jgi:dihydroflavonol-4-reductase
MRVLVTGASGLVGASLVRALLKKGHTVRALLRPSSDAAALNPLPLERVHGDVLDASSVGEAVAGCRVVYHCATPFAYWGTTAAEERAAVDGACNVIRAAHAARVRRMVLTGSSVVFGSSASPATRTERDSPAPDEPVSPYVAAKLAQYREARKLARRLGLELVTVCPTVVVGPHDHRLSPSNGLIVNYLGDPFRSTFPGGVNVVAASDVAQGHILAAQRGRPGGSYILGAENLEWRQVHGIIADLAGLPAPLLTATRVSSYLAASGWELYALLTGTRPAVTRHEARMVGRYYWYDHSAAHALGYRPRPARLALAEAVSWLIASRHVSGAVRRSLRVGAEVYAARTTWEDAGHGVRT